MPKKNKLDAVNFCKIFDMFGEQAAKDTLKDVNEGKISEKNLEKYLYDDKESKEQYAERLRKEYKDECINAKIKVSHLASK